jgi:hypothetical protein
MYSKISFLFTFFTFIFSVSFNAQEIGKILSAEAADSEFGKVKESVSIKTSEVNNWIGQTEDKIMFRMANKELTVLGDSRKLLYSASSYSENNDTFYLYSKTKLIELISKGKNQNTSFEIRGSVFTISNGIYTLEYSVPCPPICD